MKNNRNKVQFTLIFVGLFLILATYIFYPIITKNKVTEKDVVKNEKTDLDDTIQNTFEEIEYNGIYNLNNPFVITSGDAYILKENLDIIYMSDMKATINMKDGRVIIITSDSGRYNKISYDCFFENNVRAFDGETTLVSDNMDLLSSEDVANIYNNVVLTNDKGSLVADKINYNLETKYYRISMFDNKKVNVKLIR